MDVIVNALLVSNGFWFCPESSLSLSSTGAQSGKRVTSHLQKISRDRGGGPAIPGCYWCW
jgi:hypothetical protein